MQRNTLLRIFEFLASIGLFSKEKILCDTLIRLFDELNIDDGETRKTIAMGVFRRGNKKAFKKKIRHGEDAAGTLSLYIANFAATNVSSGRFHAPDGTMGPEGSRLLEVFHKATKSAVDYGALNTEQADAIISDVSKIIQETGQKIAYSNRG